MAISCATRPSARQTITVSGQHDELTQPVARGAVVIQAAILRFFGTDGDQIFVGGQPVERVEGQVAVGDLAGTKEAIRGPLRRAEYYKAPIITRLARGVSSGTARTSGPFTPFFGIDGSVARWMRRSYYRR